MARVAAVSAQTPVMDPATGISGNLAWTVDPASGFGLYPTAAKSAPALSGGATLFDPAAGLQLDRPMPPSALRRVCSNREVL